MDIKKLGSALGAAHSAIKQAGEKAKEARQEAGAASSEAKRDVARAAQEAERQAVKFRDDFEKKHPGARTARQQAADVFERGKTLISSPEAKGTSIGVDDNPTRPYRFGYGEKKDTLAEKRWAKEETSAQRRESFTHPGTLEEVSRSTEESGLKVRLFGARSQETLSAAIGVEAEAGLKSVREDFSSGTQTEAFLGARGRAYAEGGALGGTVASELFVGGDVHQQSGENRGGSQPWGVERQQASVGARVVNKAHAGVLGASLRLQAEVGARYRWEFQQHQPVVGGVGLLNTVAFDLFAGATGDAHAKVGPKGAGVLVEGFAGARMGIEERVAVAYDGSELLGARLRGEAWLGVGAKAEAQVGPDWDTKSVALKASVGAAAGVGGSVSVDVTFDGSDLFGKEQDSRSPATETQPLFPRK